MRIRSGLLAMAMVYVGAAAMALTGVPSNDAGIIEPPKVNTVPGACVTINNTLGTVTGTWGSVTGIQTDRLYRNGVPSTCAVPKACPGPWSVGARTYDAFTFANASAAPVCVDVDMTTVCPNGIHLAVYSGSYDPTNVCTNYLADSGSSSLSGSLVGLSVTVGAGQTIVVVVHEVNTDMCVGSSYTLTLNNACTSPPPPCTPVNLNLVANPGFETGNLTSWTVDGASYPPLVNTAQPHTGTYSALLGNVSGAEPFGDSSFYQTITLPATPPATLSFWYWPYSVDSITYDWQDAYVQNSTGTTLATIMHLCSNAQAWTNQTFDLTPYAGQTIRIKFLAHQDGVGDDTGMYVDDVAITRFCAAAFDLSFYDDYGRSQLCVNSTTGAWKWLVLKGYGTGKVYTGAGTLTTGSGYQRLAALPGSGFGLNLTYYSTAHRADASFSYRPDAVSSVLADQNTTNDPACP